MRGFNVDEIDDRCQFHQHFKNNFFIPKCFAQRFSSNSLTLYFFGARISAQKLLIKCWWNWLQNCKTGTGQGLQITTNITSSFCIHIEEGKIFSLEQGSQFFKHANIRKINIYKEKFSHFAYFSKYINTNTNT